MQTPPTELQVQALRLIFTLEYYAEDLATTSMKLIEAVTPLLKELVAADPAKAFEVAEAMVKAVDVNQVRDETLRETFSEYCKLISVEWESDL